MPKYQLCLFYSTFKYEPLLNQVFTSFHDIDSYTTQFQNEKELRNSNSSKINAYMNANYHYISVIPNEEERLGKIVILNMDSMEYIKPLYKDTQKNASPKKLINDISKKLKDSNSIDLLNSFLNHFKKTFGTQYNFIHHKLKTHINNINYLNNQTPVTEKQQQSYNKILSIIKETLKMGYNKNEDTIAEDKHYKLRLMNNYLDYKLGLSSKKVSSSFQSKSVKDNKEQTKSKNEQLNLNPSSTKSIKKQLSNSETQLEELPIKPLSSNTQCAESNQNNQSPVVKTQAEMHKAFLEEVIEKAFAEGREDALLDLMEPYNRDICETYFSDNTPSKTKR